MTPMTDKQLEAEHDLRIGIFAIFCSGLFMVAFIAWVVS